MQKFLSELQRRKVLRVASGYVVAGWVILQVALSLQAAMKLPDAFATIVVALLLLGFPVAVLVSWFFEFTPEGIKRTLPSGETTPLKPQTADFALAAALVLVLAAVVVKLAMPPQPQPAATTVSAPNAEPAIPQASIAVLPFADLSPAGDQGYFSDGIAEEILNVLAHTDGLKVASRTSAFQYRKNTQGIPAIARALNVRHILEGSVRKAGDTVRITAQLIDAKGDVHLWSQTYDRPLTTATIFAIQDEIAQAIVTQLSTTIGGENKPAPAAVTRPDTDNLDAYDLYLKGRHLFITRTKIRLGEAATVLKAAIAKDPKFARAWETLAAVYEISTAWGLGTESDYHKLASDAVETALKLQPTLSLPYIVRAHQKANGVAFGGHTDWEAAIADADRAVELDPKNSTAYAWRSSIFQQLGYFDRASADNQHCLDLDPAYELCRRAKAWTLNYAGRLDEALKLYEQGLASGYMNSDVVFAPALVARGDRIGALAVVMREFEEAPQIPALLIRTLSDTSYRGPPDHDVVAMVEAAQLRASDLSTIWLILKDYARIPERDVEDQDIWWHRFDPAWLKSPVRRKLMREWGVPDYWRKHGFPLQCRAVGAVDFECN